MEISENWSIDDARESVEKLNCRHCHGTNRLSSTKEKFDNAEIIEVRCLNCKEIEVFILQVQTNV